MDDTGWELLNSIGLIISACVFIFGLGYNWRRVTVLEDAFEKRLKTAELIEREMQAHMASTYVRQDVLSVELRNVALELSALKSKYDLAYRQLEYLTHRERAREQADQAS